MFGIGGCRSKTPIDWSDPTEGMPVPKHVKGASDEERAKLKAILTRKGVTVITMGQEYLISIPSNTLFYHKSPRVRWESYGLLNDVACYLKQFRKVSMSVIAHTPKTDFEKRNQSLSVARARNVADYLWSQAIDARFVSMQGMGSEKPIYNRADIGANVNNDRVEITFRNVIV